MGYQKIDIGGFYDQGKDRTKDYYQIFPEKPLNLRILDIGCHNGFYILKAMSEGARLTIGLDKIDKFLEVGRRASKFLGYDDKMRFIHFDVIENKLPHNIGDFSVVLCLNILHYFTLEQIDKLLDTIDRLCGNMMVFEILYCDDGDWKKVQRRTKVIALSENFFKKKFPNYNIEVMDSLVTENRKILKVIK